MDGEQNAWPYGGFTIYFASPMDLDSLKDKVIDQPGTLARIRYLFLRLQQQLHPVL